MDNLIQIEIPTPFTIGPVNCYAFTGDGLTLLDPGPATEQAYKKLSNEIENYGYTVTDVDRILITHPHMDHFGIANRIVEESGARTFAHRDAIRRLSDPDGLFRREQDFFQPFLEKAGVPSQYTETAVTLPEAYMDYHEALSIDNGLTEGSNIDLGTELRTIHTPGHAPGSVCFTEPSDGVAFTGDHVLKHISPNPLLTVVPGSKDKRTRSLPLYLDSLKKMQNSGATMGHGGHGNTIHDLSVRIKEIVEHHHGRKETIADMLAEESMTAYDVMQELFPDLPATEIFPGMSEAIGHLDLLEDEGRVNIIEKHGVQRYELRQSA